MTEDEIVKILKFISDAYPGKFEYPLGTKEANISLQKTWLIFLKDYDFKVTIVVMKKLFVNKPDWPPTVGQIVKAIEDMLSPPEDKFTAGEAWKKVIEAIQRHGALYGTKKAMDSLPMKAQEAVKAVGGLIAIANSDSRETYMMNQFCKAYKELSDKIDRSTKLPASIRRETDVLTERFTQPQIEE